MKKKMLAALLALALIIIGIAPSTLALNAAAAGINSFVLPENEETTEQPNPEPQPKPPEEFPDEVMSFYNKLMNDCADFDTLTALIEDSEYTAGQLEDFFNKVKALGAPEPEAAPEREASPRAAEANLYDSLAAHLHEICLPFYNSLMAAETFADYMTLLEPYSEALLTVVGHALSESELAALSEHLDALYEQGVEDGSITVPEPAAQENPDLPGSGANAPAVNFTNAAPLMDFSTPEKGGMSALADDDPLKLSKIVSDNGDGTYTVHLEAYTTGEITTRKTPCDIVLVLDQSLSMCAVMQENVGWHYRKVYGDINSLTHDNSYYYLENGQYKTAYWCNGGIFSHDPGWYTVSHNLVSHGGTRLTPVSVPGGGGTQFYEYVNNYTRMEILIQALDGFIGSVRSEALGVDNQAGTYDDVKHRIAVVGFGADGVYSPNYGFSAFENTEILIGTNQYIYPDAAAAQYPNALQNMWQSSGYNNVCDSVNILEAKGQTFSNFGLEMAKGILDNAVETYTDGKLDIRNKVVIFFTDGFPGYNNVGWSSTQTNPDFNLCYITENKAITQAKTIKGNDTTVYAVGIFEGASGALPLPNYHDGYVNDDGYFRGEVRNMQDLYDNANRYMHYVSSNYPAAGTNIKNSYAQNPDLDGDSYCLSASDSDALNAIFDSISSQINAGPEADETTEVRDVLSPYFQLPEGAAENDITVKTAKAKRSAFNNPNNANSWETPVPFNPHDPYGVHIGQDSERNAKVSVDGFDFMANFVSASGRSETDPEQSGNFFGRKLIIEFNIVPKPGFLGGNDVPTNGAASGVYNPPGENGDLLGAFPNDNKFDIPIPDISVTVPDKNIYLHGALTDEQLKAETLLYTVPFAYRGFTFDTDPTTLSDDQERWTVENVGDTVGQWAFAEQGVIDGGCMQAKSYNIANYDHRLISPVVTGGGRVTFKIATKTSTWPEDAVQIYVATTADNGATWNCNYDENPLATFPDESNPITCSVNLSAYAGQQIKIIFRHQETNNEGGNGWYIQLDDVWIAEPGSTPENPRRPADIEDWQKAFVNITQTVTVNEPVPGANGYEDDTIYTVSVTIAPKDTTGTVTEKSASATGKINVFKPELTFKDSEACYGGKAPADYSANLVKTEWKHGETLDTAAVPPMIGDKPVLTFEYTPKADCFRTVEGVDYIVTRDDIPVKVTVKILSIDVTRYCAFVHQACTNETGCGWDTMPHIDPLDGDPAFLLHVKTCTLTVEKTIKDGKTYQPGESFIFRVSGDNPALPIEMEVVAHVGADGTVQSITINGLPVGNYTVTEDTGWSWRYEVTQTGGVTVELKCEGGRTGTANFTNNLVSNKWLTWEAAVDNRWGKDSNGNPVIVPHTKPEPEPANP